MDDSMGYLLLRIITCFSIVAAAYDDTHNNSAITACQQLKGNLTNSIYVPSQRQYLPLSEENWYKSPVVFSPWLSTKSSKGLKPPGKSPLASFSLLISLNFKG